LIYAHPQAEPSSYLELEMHLYSSWLALKPLEEFAENRQQERLAKQKTEEKARLGRYHIEKFKKKLKMLGINPDTI
jgi:hypothetical protein